MTTRRAKQIIYGTFYIIVLLLFVGIFYLIFIRPFTTGPVIAVCTENTCAPTSTASISTSIVSIFVTTPGHYTFLSQVLNNNPDFGAPLFNYQVNVYDATGALIESVPGQSFIYQSQSKYLMVPNVTIPQAVDHATLQIINAEWIASSTLGVIPQLIVQNTQASMTSSSVAVGGQLINSNIGSFEQVIAMVIFKDSNGNPIGASQTELDNVQAGSTNNFSVMYPAVENINPVQNQIIIYALR
jgi:hypothetical protein